uniref:Bromo domain-containing protein n=1 Tax=Meloidogyne hapla TaxID=6305 RepID=A0A1I8BIL0_MELHA
MFENSSWKYWLESYVMTNTNLDELFDEKEEKTHPYINEGLPEIVHDCRKDLYFIEYQEEKSKYTKNNHPKYIIDLLNYYRKPYKFIEENSDFRLLNYLSENIKKIKDGVIFNMEIEKEFNKNNKGKDKNLNEINNIIFGELTAENINETFSKYEKENIKEVNKNNNKMKNLEEKIKEESQKQLFQENKKDLNKNLVKNKLETGQNSSANLPDKLLNNLNQNNIKTNNEILPKENEWHKLPNKKKRGKKINLNNDKNFYDKTLKISDKGKNIEENNKNIVEEQLFTKLNIDNFNSPRESLKISEESEKSNETKSVDIKNSKQKNKKKETIKEKEHKNNKKSKEKDLLDIFYIKQSIKQNNRENQEKIQKQKKAEKEARIAKEIELKNSKNERKKEKRKLKNQKEKLIEQNFQKLPPGKINDFIESINMLVTTVKRVSEFIDIFDKEKTLDIYCLIDKSISSFFESIQTYFTLFNLSLEIIGDWRFDNKFYEKYLNGVHLIAKSYPETITQSAKFIEYGYKFVLFYQRKGNDLINIVRENIEKALAIALNEKQNPERIISVEDTIGYFI